MKYIVFLISFMVGTTGSLVGIANGFYRGWDGNPPEWTEPMNVAIIVSFALLNVSAHYIRKEKQLRMTP